MLEGLTRAEILLILVYDCTKHEGDDWANPISRYFIPSAYGTYSETLKEKIDVSGAGDANALKGLERRGLIKAMPIAKYAYALTEEGLVKVQKLLESR